MKANELRIGNLFLCQLDAGKDAEVLQAGWLTENGILNKYNGSCPYEACNPIPITPEWLERCGIVEKESSLPGKTKIIGEGNFTIESVEDGNLKFYLPFNRKIEIQYVHQLQNLFYNLTGEELNVKL